jgi:ribosomal protein S18 acetylase RimI-like enzyme
MKIRQLDHDEEPELLAFMEMIDASFDPPFSARVDVRQWLKKVFKLGMILVSGERKNINGVIAFYCNDKDSLQAFITFLCVANSARKQGIGRKLLEEAICIFRREGMKSALLTTWAENKAAIFLYESCGFKEDDAESKRSGKMALRLIL